MGRKKKVQEEVGVGVVEQERVAAGAKIYATYSDYVEQITGNWSQLALAMDAALVVKTESESYVDEADMVIEGAAFSFLKDIENMRGFFMAAANVEEVGDGELNFVSVPEEVEVPF